MPARKNLDEAAILAAVLTGERHAAIAERLGCPSADCPLRTECRRNEASGTNPGGRQSWTAWTWRSIAGGDAIICDGYAPTNPSLRERLLPAPASGALKIEEADRDA